MLILGDFKSLFPEVLILVGLKSLGMRMIRRFWYFLEVLILVDFISCRINRFDISWKC